MGPYYYLLNDTKKHIVHLDNCIKQEPMTGNAAVHYAMMNYMMLNPGDSMCISSDIEEATKYYSEIDLLYYKGFDAETKHIIDKLQANAAWKGSGKKQNTNVELEEKPEEKLIKRKPGKPPIKNKMKIPHTEHPTNKDKLYIRQGFHEFFLGPFDDTDAVANAMIQLDLHKPYWDYDGFMICYGKTPLPDDYVNGFEVIKEKRESVPEDIRKLIEAKRQEYEIANGF